MDIFHAYGDTYILNPPRTVIGVDEVYWLRVTLGPDQYDQLVAVSDADTLAVIEDTVRALILAS